MRISVVINTLNRAAELRNCLESLRKQSNTNFEVVVVDQSTSNETQKLVSKYKLKYIRSNAKNLSLSRNIGIDQSAGDIIAFIDDDATADKNWIKTIKKNFKQNEISILVGKVFEAREGQTRKLQYENGIVSEYGQVQDFRPSSETKYEKGADGWYLRPMGANSVFLKKALVDNEGFDEFYEYNHDETDMTIRIIGAGGRAIYDPELIVDHHMSNSHNRKGKYHLNWYVQSKNNVYFGLKNSSDFLLLRLIKSTGNVIFKKTHYPRLLKFLVTMKITPLRFFRDYWDFNRGVWVGTFAGLFTSRKLYKFSGKTEFLKFK